MEYRIGGIGSSRSQIYSHNREIARISREIYEAIQKNTKVLWDFSTPHLAWTSLSKNQEQLTKFLALRETELSVADRVYLLGPESRELQVECLYLVMIFLASASSYLSITERHIQENFDDDILVEWNKKRQALHTDNFSYRFCYELRNYAQHYGLPISELEFEMSPTHLTKIRPVIFSGDLSHDRSKLNKKILLEIRSRPPEKFDLAKLTSGYFSCIKEIHRNTFACHRSRFDECDEYLFNLVRFYKFQRDENPVIFVRPINGTSDRDRMEYIPIYLLNEIKTCMDNLH